MREIRKVKSFTIPVKGWLHGDNADESLLRREDGMRCCVGIFLEACGVPESKTLAVDVMRENQARRLGLDVMGGTIPELYARNDAPQVPLAFRKQQIRKLFAEIGVKVRFK